MTFGSNNEPRLDKPHLSPGFKALIYVAAVFFSFWYGGGELRGERGGFDSGWFFILLSVGVLFGWGIVLLLEHLQRLIRDVRALDADNHPVTMASEHKELEWDSPNSRAEQLITGKGTCVMSEDERKFREFMENTTPFKRSICWLIGYGRFYVMIAFAILIVAIYFYIAPDLKLDDKPSNLPWLIVVVAVVLYGFNIHLKRSAAELIKTIAGLSDEEGRPGGAEEDR